MALNSVGLEALAALLRSTLAYAQLHSAGAGVTGMDNVIVPARLPITWAASSGGSFGMQSPLRFVGGEPESPVHSITVWDSEMEGTFYGEFPLLAGDSALNIEGEFVVTAIDFLAQSSDYATGTGAPLSYAFSDLNSDWILTGAGTGGLSGSRLALWPGADLIEIYTSGLAEITSAQVELAQVGTVTGSTLPYCPFRLAGGLGFLEMMVRADGNLWCRNYGGANTGIYGESFITYNSVSMKYFRISILGGDLVNFETSPDTVTWTTRWTCAPAATIDLTQLRVYFAGWTQDALGTGTAPVLWDNLIINRNA